MEQISGGLATRQVSKTYQRGSKPRPGAKGFMTKEELLKLEEDCIRWCGEFEFVSPMFVLELVREIKRLNGWEDEKLD